MKYLWILILGLLLLILFAPYTVMGEEFPTPQPAETTEVSIMPTMIPATKTPHDRPTKTATPTAYPTINPYPAPKIDWSFLETLLFFIWK